MHSPVLVGGFSATQPRRIVLAAHATAPAAPTRNQITTREYLTIKNADLGSSCGLRSSGSARVARPVSVTAFQNIYLVDWPPHGSRTFVRCNGEPAYAFFFARFIRRRQPASLLNGELSSLGCIIRRPWDEMVLVTKYKENNTKEWLPGSLR